MIDERTRREVRRRAGERCEYCRLPESAGDITFHVEHIVAQQHRRDDEPSNLALACDRCNLYPSVAETVIAERNSFRSQR